MNTVVGEIEEFRIQDNFEEEARESEKEEGRLRAPPAGSLEMRVSASNLSLV